MAGGITKLEAKLSWLNIDFGCIDFLSRTRGTFSSHINGTIV